MGIEDRIREAVDRAHLRLREEFEGHRQHLTDSVTGILAEEQAAWRSHLESAVDEARKDADREAEARVDAARDQLRKESDEQIAAAREQAQRDAADQINAARDEAQRDAQDHINTAREQARHEAADQIRAARDEAQREAAEHAHSAREQAQREAAEHVSSAREQAQREAVEHANAAREQAQREAAEQIAAAHEQAHREAGDQVNAAREQAQRDIQAHVDAAQTLADTAAANAAAAAAHAAPGTGGEVVSRVLGAVRRISDAESLRAVLEALAAGTRAEVARVALMLVDHDRLSPWTSFGFDPAHEPGEVDVQAVSAVRAAIADRRVLALSPAEGSTAPAFLQAAPDREMRIFPLVVGGNVVAVVCGESASPRPGETSPAWSQAIEVLVQYASLRLENLTSLRTVEALTTSG